MALFEDIISTRTFFFPTHKPGIYLRWGLDWINQEARVMYNVVFTVLLKLTGIHLQGNHSTLPIRKTSLSRVSVTLKITSTNLSPIKCTLNLYVQSSFLTSCMTYLVTLAGLLWDPSLPTARPVPLESADPIGKCGHFLRCTSVTFCTKPSSQLHLYSPYWFWQSFKIKPWPHHLYTNPG